MLTLNSGTEAAASAIVRSLPGVSAEMTLELAVDGLHEAFFQVTHEVTGENYANVEHAVEVTLARLVRAAFGEAGSARIAYAIEHLQAIEIKQRVEAAAGLI